MYICLIVNTEKLAVYGLLLEKVSYMYQLHIRKKILLIYYKNRQYLSEREILIPDINSFPILC